MIEQLKEQLNQKNNIEFKECSSSFSGGQGVTLIEIGNLALFNGAGPDTMVSRTVAMSNVYDFLIHYRDMISNFKKGLFD